MTWYYIISKGQISLTGMVLSVYPLVTVILSLLFLHETLTGLQILAVFIIISGTVILAFPSEISKESFRHPQQWLPWGIGGAVIIGIVQFLTKIGTSHSDGNTFTFLMGLSYVPALLICALFDKKGRNIKQIKWKSSITGLIGVAMLEFNLIPLNLAFATGPASLVSPITTLNSVIMVILAVKYLKERITKIQYIGIAITLAGTILIGITW
jgi:drug/metabolite transporter (DMT)-like permease